MKEESWGAGHIFRQKLPMEKSRTPAVDQGGEPGAAPRGAVPLRRGSEADTYHQADVLDLPNAHIDAFPLVHGQTDVDEVVLVSHAADLHEGEEVAVVVTAFGLQGLTKRAQSGKTVVSHVLRGGRPHRH